MRWVILGFNASLTTDSAPCVGSPSSGPPLSSSLSTSTWAFGGLAGVLTSAINNDVVPNNIPRCERTKVQQRKQKTSRLLQREGKWLKNGRMENKEEANWVLNGRRSCECVRICSRILGDQHVEACVKSGVWKQQMHVIACIEVKVVWEHVPSCWKKNLWVHSHNHSWTCLKLEISERTFLERKKNMLHSRGGMKHFYMKIQNHRAFTCSCMLPFSNKSN